jgi:hypothetical protein
MPAIGWLKMHHAGMRGVAANGKRPDMLRIVLELSSELLAVSFFVAAVAVWSGLAAGII